MNMRIEAARTSRIVVALDPDNREFAIELASTLALAGAPELFGLFVENAYLIAHARSRLAREIMFTGRERRLQRSVLERQLRAQAACARATFEATASRLGLPHTFQITRGDVVTEMIRGATNAEALVVSLPKEGRGTSAWPNAALRRLIDARLPLVLLAREGWLSGRSIAVIVDAEAADSALEAATRLARRSGSPVTVLVAGSMPGNAQLADQVSQALRLRNLEFGGVVALRKYAASDIAQAALACRARLLVLPSPGPQDEADLINELLRRLPSALMLVRR